MAETIVRRRSLTNLSIYTSPESIENKIWSPPLDAEATDITHAPLPTDIPLPFPPPLTREMLATESFNPDKFLASRRHLPMDELKHELDVHLKSLKNELVELINRDYSSFIDLSTNLKGVDKLIDEISGPLGKMRDDVQVVRSKLQGVVDSLQEKLIHRASIREKKAALQLFINIHESVKKVESLLLISNEGGSNLISGEDESSAKQIERVAIEYNQMQYLVNKGKDLPFVENIDWRITRIKDTLRGNLSSSLKSALQLVINETNHAPAKETLTQILRTYALIDQTKAAETVIREEMVEPFVQTTVTRKFLDKSPQPILIPSTTLVASTRSSFSPVSRTFAPRVALSSSKEPLAIMYNKVLNFISNECFLLLEITKKVLKDTSYEILVNSVWTGIVVAVTERLSIIFNPGNPNIFYKNYTISMNFVSSVESMCSSKKTLLYLRTHSTYTEFMKRWQLAVYFQLRFKEISSQVEEAMGTRPEIQVDNQDSTKLRLPASKSTIMAIERCWANGVFVYGLSHRFWKLTLQILQRYKNWVKTFINDLEVGTHSEKSVNSPKIRPANSSGRSSNGSIPTSAVNVVSSNEALDEKVLKQLAVIASDVENLAVKVKEFYRDVICAKIPTSMVDEPIIEESINTSLSLIQSDLPDISRRITNILVKRCVENLRYTRSITSQYRYTNKKPPTEYSNFVPHIMKPLVSFCEVCQPILSEKRRKEWNLIVAEAVSMSYSKNVNDLLTTLKKTEESLRRIKMRGAASSIMAIIGGTDDSVVTMSDEDKIRLQILLDVRQFGKELENLGCTLSEVQGYAELYRVVEPYEAIEKL